MSLMRTSAVAILLLGLSAPTASAQTGGLSEAERVILSDVLKDVLGRPASSDVGDPIIIDDRDDVDDRDRDEEWGKGKGRGNGLPPGLAKKGGLPPGLAKRDSLPPGLAKRLERDLPNRDVEVTDDNVIIRDKQTGAIVQIIRDILAGTGQ